MSKQSEFLLGYIPRWDVEIGTLDIINRVEDRVKTGRARMISLLDCVTHITEQDVEGAIVECGVYRGGGMMAIALQLIKLSATIENSATARDLYLYDTFEGQPAPSAQDIRLKDGVSANFLVDSEEAADILSFASKEDVEAGMNSTGYPKEHVKLVQGKVEATIPAQVPDKIALLRLDTDYYESTKHELEHLYPRLVSGGVLVIDDYGWWAGARTAVDEYFASLPTSPLLVRVEEARICVKP